MLQDGKYTYEHQGRKVVITINAPGSRFEILDTTGRVQRVHEGFFADTMTIEILKNNAHEILYPAQDMDNSTGTLTYEGS